ncbi:MAG TPA: ribosome silencing factor [Gammaproteobacteria bacterium]|jgi:ribosome-associated protein|nr:ribosome silencing factor [Gammaproteobacteria bacterium]
MNAESIRKLAVEALEDAKGIDIDSIDVRTLTSITDYMIICTGRSTRHVKTLAENVVVKAKEMKINPIRAEGEEAAEWVVVDLGDAVVHIMLAATRTFYHLEDLWEPVKELRDHQASS